MSETVAGPVRPGARAPIALFAPSLRGGGAERNMANLAGGLARRGERVILVLARAEGPFLEELHETVEVVDLDADRVAATLFPLARFIRERRPRALLSTPTHANLVAIWARRLAGSSCRVVVREANTLSRTAAHTGGVRGRVMPLLVRWCYPWADAVVAVSDGVARDLRERAAVRNVETVPNPAVTPDLASRALEPIDHPWLGTNGPPVIIAVGSLTQQKDYPTLLAAFRHLRNERPCRLLILGEGDERRGLEERIEQLGLTDDVELRGFVPNPFPYMAAADVLALSSRWEGWPNVCAQALALGTPVVATRCPHGPEEILEGGRFGELVPVGDARALAEALGRTLDDPPDPHLLKARGGDFTLDRAADAYARILDPVHR